MADASSSIKIALGSDHGGFDLKQHLKKWLTDRGHAVQDCGVHDKSPADYPLIAAAVAGLVADGSASRGILIDGAGIGSCMVANKFPGVRAALCYDISSANNSREHNDANVLTLGAGLIGAALAEQIAEVWLKTECTAERHLRRVAMIGDIEEKQRSRPGPATKAAIAPTITQTPEQPSRMTPDEIRNMSGLTNLTQADLEKIAERIAGMMSQSGWPTKSACSCCGEDCHGRCAETGPDTVRGLIGMGAGRIGMGLGGGPIPRDVAQYIDHTLLKPEATRAQIEQLCKEAKEHSFASVCINPNWVKIAASILKGSPVAVCTVVGFPLGAHVAEVKALEARRAIRDGAREIDMVINIGALKSNDDDLAFQDIKAVVDACMDGRAICKVIIECALLTDDEKVRACMLSRKARADFVKTSTGFASTGATAHDVALMSEAVAGTRMGVKAAGGIRSYGDFKAMVEAGATRIGASAGIAIIRESKGDAPAAAAPTPSEAAPQKY